MTSHSIILSAAKREECNKFVASLSSVSKSLHCHHSFIGHDYQGQNFHAEDLIVNNYVREIIVRGIKVRE
jgi:hypothetical protein